MEKEERAELLEKLRQAHIADDRVEIERLEQEFHSVAQSDLQAARQRFDEGKEAVPKVEAEAAEHPKKAAGDRRRLYKEMIALYRQTDALRTDIKNFKKQMREGDNDEVDAADV